MQAVHPGAMTDWKAMGADKKITAGICAILVGWLGVHKFILGYTTEGIIICRLVLLRHFDLWTHEHSRHHRRHHLSDQVRRRLRENLHSEQEGLVLELDPPNITVKNAPPHLL